MRNQNQRERVAARKAAFDEIIGDPWSKEDLTGQYTIQKNKETIRAVNIEDSTSSTINSAKPNNIDFICDVENAILYGLQKYNIINSVAVLLEKFHKTYVTGEEQAFSQPERAQLEQVIGQILIARKISPASKYFTATRQKKEKG